MKYIRATSDMANDVQNVLHMAINHISEILSKGSRGFLLQTS